MIKELNLVPDDIPLIRAGKITQIIRFGKYQYAEGLSTAYGGDLHIDIRVTNVEFIPARKLDVIDAKRAGFNTLDELKSVLLDPHPSSTENSWVTVVEFELAR